MTLNTWTEPLHDATPREPYRSFKDRKGREWLVWRIAEDVVADVKEAPSLRRAWLIFLGPNGETRRVAPVPNRWKRMKDSQLYQLLERAARFTPAKPGP